MKEFTAPVEGFPGTRTWFYTTIPFDARKEFGLKGKIRVTGHTNMVNFLAGTTPKLKRPSSILVISAHWEEQTAAVTSAPHPPLFYDYYGFPEETYRITYDAPGEPTLAVAVSKLLETAGIPSRLDDTHGFGK